MRLVRWERHGRGSTQDNQRRETGRLLELWQEEGG